MFLIHLSTDLKGAGALAVRVKWDHHRKSRTWAMSSVRFKFDR